MCGSVKTQSEMIIRLKDVSKRQNKLIHQLQDKVEVLSRKLQPVGAPPVSAQPSEQPPVSQSQQRAAHVPPPQPLMSLRPPSNSCYPALPQTEPSPSIQQVERFSCPDCRLYCSSFPSLDNHIKRSHGRPNHQKEQNLTLMVGDSTMSTVNGRLVEAALGGSLLTGRSATKSGPWSALAGHPGRAYNSVSNFPGCKFPESSFERVVPRLLSTRTVTNLVLQSPTSDITNLLHTSEPQQKDMAIKSAQNMFSIMERARADHPSIRKIVALEQLPRADNAQLSTLASLYNATLRNLAAAAPLNSQCVIVVASHTSLLPATQDQAIRAATFGSPSARSSDGIHFRGKEGGKRHTSSIISALKSAGLGGWSSQGPRRAGRQEAGRSYSQVVSTSNQY